MATSEVEICKLAQAKVGNTNFFANFSDGSVEANVCAIEYPQTRDVTLERLEPRFATKRQVLTALTDVNSSWDYVYALPSDFISLQNIVNPFGVDIPKDLQEAYDIEAGASGGRVLLTNVGDAEIIYTYRHTTVAQWPAVFTEAVIYGLAAALALSLKKDLQLADALGQVYYRKLGEANASLEKQRNPGPEYRSSILRARD